METSRATYLKAIEQHFVALRGRGWMVSSRDVALADRWRARLVPLRVVLRVIEEGMARYAENHPADAPLPSTLQYFEAAVDRAMIARRERMLDDAQGAAPVPARPRAEVLGRVLEAIADAGRAQQDEGAREALRRAWRELKQASAGEDIWALTSRADAAIVDDLLASLSRGDRDALEREVGAAVEAAGGDGMSERGRQDSLRLELERRLRGRFGVRDLVEILIEEGV